MVAGVYRQNLSPYAQAKIGDVVRVIADFHITDNSAVARCVAIAQFPPHDLNEQVSRKVVIKILRSIPLRKLIRH